MNTKIYKSTRDENGAVVYVRVASLPDDAKFNPNHTRAENGVAYNTDPKIIDELGGGEIEGTMHPVAIGNAKFYVANERIGDKGYRIYDTYVAVEWQSVTQYEKSFFGYWDYYFAHESAEEIVEAIAPAYAPYTNDDMALLAEPCLSELMAHTMAHNENLVVYKFVGDIDDAMQKSLFYGHQFNSYNGKVYTTAFLYARQMTDKYINDNRYGKTGDYRVNEYWYRTGKAGLNVTCWQVVPTSEAQAKAGNDSLKGYTGDWDYDTRGRGEYSRRDGTVRGNYDVGDSDYEG